MIKSTLKLCILLILVLSLLITVGCSSDDSNKKTSDSSAQSNKEEGNQSQTDTESTDSTSSNPTDGDNHDRPDYVTDSSAPLISDSSTAVSSEQASTSTNGNEITADQEKIYKKAISTVFDSIIKGDFSKAKENLTGDYPFDTPVGFDTRTMVLVKKIFAEINYETVSLKRVSESQVIATVNVKALNFKKIFQAYMKKAREISTSNPTLQSQQLDKKMDNAFLSILKKHKGKYVTKSIKLTLINNGESWSAVHSADFAKACLGGIDYVSDVFK